MTGEYTAETIIDPVTNKYKVRILSDNSKEIVRKIKEDEAKLKANPDTKEGLHFKDDRASQKHNITREIHLTVKNLRCDTYELDKDTQPQTQAQEQPRAEQQQQGKEDNNKDAAVSGGGGEKKDEAGGGGGGGDGEKKNETGGGEGEKEDERYKECVLKVEVKEKYKKWIEKGKQGPEIYIFAKIFSERGFKEDGSDYNIEFDVAQTLPILEMDEHRAFAVKFQRAIEEEDFEEAGRLSELPLFNVVKNKLEAKGKSFKDYKSGDDEVYLSGLDQGEKRRTSSAALEELKNASASVVTTGGGTGGGGSDNNKSKASLKEILMGDGLCEEEAKKTQELQTKAQLNKEEGTTCFLTLVDTDGKGNGRRLFEEITALDPNTNREQIRTKEAVPYAFIPLLIMAVSKLANDGWWALEYGHGLLQTMVLDFFYVWGYPEKKISNQTVDKNDKKRLLLQAIGRLDHELPPYKLYMKILGLDEASGFGRTGVDEMLREWGRLNITRNMMENHHGEKWNKPLELKGATDDKVASTFAWVVVNESRIKPGTTSTSFSLSGGGFVSHDKLSNKEDIKKNGGFLVGRLEADDETLPYSFRKFMKETKNNQGSSRHSGGGRGGAGYGRGGDRGRGFGGGGGARGGYGGGRGGGGDSSQSGTRGGAGRGGGGRGGGKDGCYSCGGSGHFARECPNGKSGGGLGGGSGGGKGDGQKSDPADKNEAWEIIKEVNKGKHKWDGKTPCPRCVKNSGFYARDHAEEACLDFDDKDRKRNIDSSYRVVLQTKMEEAKQGKLSFKK